MRFVGLLLVFAAACGYPRPAPFGDDGGNTIDGSAGDPPLDLRYADNPAYFTRAQAGSDAASVGGGPVMTWSVTPDLPTGVHLDQATGTISGVPTIGVPTTKYTVTAANANGMTTADLELRVNDISSIAVGTFHSCAITAGSVVCWGDNQMGQVGNGTSGADVPVPADVAGTAGATSVCTGEAYSCALINGAVKCWGSNQYGQLGTGNVGGMATTPQQVFGLTTGFTAITCGQNHACALSNGNVLCWGKNDEGEVGNGTMAGPVPQPVQVQQLSGTASMIASESSGRTTCASVQGGTSLRCWGDGTGGQIMPNQGGSYPSPIQIAGFPPPGLAIDSFAPGVAHICGVSQGSTFCWGENNHGQTGQPVSMGFTTSPTVVGGLASGSRIVASGHFHTCVVLVAGALCWGYNIQGQLGNAMQLDNSVPQSVMGLSGGVVQVAAGANESCALAGNHVLCWGDGQFHHLGNGSTNDSAVPVPVTGL